MCLASLYNLLKTEKRFRNPLRCKNLVTGSIRKVTPTASFLKSTPENKMLTQSFLEVSNDLFI